mmetsp:Transcript_13128/g.26736  ORF Transcript_13128/g.26736 Transcript_13128/m.26736 type:complete len:82 (-) Transcript_13128:362-607(-)
MPYRWKRFLDKHIPSADRGIPIVLVTNKADLVSGVHAGFELGAHLRQTTLKLNFDKWYIASAKTGMNSIEPIDYVVKAVLC